MIKGNYQPIKTIEIIQSVFVQSVVPSYDGNSATINLYPNRAFTNLYFTKSSDNILIAPKDQAVSVNLQFSSPGLLAGNSYELNLSLYRAVVVKITMCDNTCMIIGDNRNPAKLSYNYDKSAGKYNFSLSWLYHRHPLFIV